MKIRYPQGSAIILLVGFVFVRLSAVFAQNVDYAIEELGVLPGGVSSYATGINNVGDVVGVSQNSNGIYHAVLWPRTGGIKDLGALGSSPAFTTSSASGINSSGVIVGQSGDTTGFIYKNGVISALPKFDLQALPNSGAYGINTAGDIVGSSTSVTQRLFVGGVTQGPQHAFVLRSGILMTDIGTILDTTGKSTAFGINDFGAVVGQSNTPGGLGFDHAFLYSGGRMTDLGVLPGFQQSSAVAINNAGQIVGSVQSGSLVSSNSNSHGFLYSGGVMRDIGTLSGGNFVVPFAINNAGQVVGTASDSRLRSSAFVYTTTSGMVDLSLRTTPTGIAILGAMSASPKEAFIGFSQANAINDLGVIVGVGSYAFGVTRAMRLIPFSAIPVRITAQPVSQTVLLGASVSFSVGLVTELNGYTGVFAFQWMKDGSPLVGATNGTLVIPNVQSSDIGGYSVAISSAIGLATSDVARLTIGSSSNAGRLTNLSIRTNAGSGDNTLIVGFVLGGVGTSGPKPVLARGVGPTLADFGVGGVLSDPTLTLVGGSATLATNDNWGGAAQIISASASVGAFALANSASKDAALYSTGLTPGGYTLQIVGVGGASGVVLAEVYDATPSSSFTAATPRFVNVSARTQVGTGANILITGFTIGGQTSKTILIRAVGPTLSQFGVGGVLADPQVKLFDSSARQIAENNDWSGSATLSAAASNVGAFALPPSSRDAALLVTLAPGSYTAQVSGVNNAVGIALVEVYELP